MTCSSMCPHFTWEVQGTKISSDVHLLPIEGCDLVLGVQWLRTLGPITMDFSLLYPSFKYMGQQVLLQGCQTTKEIKFMTMSAIQKYFNRYPSVMLCLLSSTDTSSSPFSIPIHPSIIHP